jgi:chloramphenicol-sensitive protein RarD
VPTSTSDGTQPTRHSDARIGTLAGIAAYSLWGVFPLVFHQLRSVSAMEVVFHRVVWTFVMVIVLIVARRDWRWFEAVRRQPGALRRLSLAGALLSTNWLVYIWAVNHDHVVEAALGYYVNPLITVALGVIVLDESLRRMQLVALGFGLLAVAVLTVDYGRVPWIALVLACSFAGYGYLKKAVQVPAVTSLAVETAVLLPAAIAGLAVIGIRGDTAFGHGSAGRDALIIALGLVTAGPLLLFSTAARRIPLSLLGLLQYLTPTLQLLCGVLVLGEPMPPGRLAGFVLVWVALALLGVDAVGTARRRPAASVPVIAPT